MAWITWSSWWRKRDRSFFWKGAGRHKLDAVAERLGIPREGQAHRASSDCVLTCRILWQLREHLPDHPGEAAALIRPPDSDHRVGKPSRLAIIDCDSGQSGAVLILDHRDAPADGSTGLARSRRHLDRGAALV